MVTNRKPTNRTAGVKQRPTEAERKAAEKRAVTRAARAAAKHYRSTLDRLAK